MIKDEREGRGFISDENILLIIEINIKDAMLRAANAVAT